MGLFARCYKGTLPPAPAWPSLCTRLVVTDADDSLASWGPQLRRFSQLRELEIAWYSGTAETLDAVLPSELAHLRTLTHLTLLNVPLARFPAWVLDLPKLRFLTVRGTDVTTIPEWIDQLSRLRTLRVENCPLITLPSALRRMTNLRELSLSDTAIRDLSPVQFPPNLQVLCFHGSGTYVRRDVTRLQQAFPHTRIWPDLSHPHWPPERRETE